MGPVSVDVGRRIKVLRQAHELSQVKLARMIGYTPQYFCLLEKGRRTASHALVIALASKLKASEDWLRTGKGDMWLKSVPSMRSFRQKLQAAKKT